MTKKKQSLQEQTVILTTYYSMKGDPNAKVREVHTEWKCVKVQDMS